MGSDLLKVTQLDSNGARAQTSRFQVTCAFWDQIMGTCWSLGRAVLALCYSRPPHRRGSQSEISGPVPALSVLLRPLEPLL